MWVGLIQSLGGLSRTRGRVWENSLSAFKLRHWFSPLLRLDLTSSALLVLRSSDLNGVVEKMVITWQKLRELRLISEAEACKCRVGKCDGSLENEVHCRFK